MEGTRYEWEDSPQAFTNRLICRYAIFETKFPKENLSNRDRMVKRKLWQGLPSTVKGRIESFLVNNYPLSQFLDRLEHERQFLLEAQQSAVCHIPGKAANPAPQLEPKLHVSSQQFEKFQQRLEGLSKQMQRKTKTPNRYCCPGCRTNDHSRDNCPRPYCPNCRNSSHFLKDCIRRPPAGACFECERQNCRRGKTRLHRSTGGFSLTVRKNFITHYIGGRQR